MKSFCFTVDDNIIFLKEITEMGCDSIFAHPYLAMYKRLHEKYDLKIQLNLFYECEEFNLSDFSDKYKDEWIASSDWLKLSFHSKFEKVNPYEFSGYDEVYEDCARVHAEILRFAGPKSLAITTTIHYCLATLDGLRALYDNGVRGLLGLYGKNQNPSVSYSRSERETEIILTGETINADGISHAALDVVLNCFDKKTILEKLERLYGRELIKVMIHEQYFYPYLKCYQKDFEEKISAAFEAIMENGYRSVFFEETI